MNNLSIKAVFIFMILSTFSFQISAQEKEKGKLADFEEEVEKGSNSDNSNDDSYNDDDENSSGFFVDFTARGVFNVFIITEEELKAGTWYSGYSDYPYSENAIGTFQSNSRKQYSVIGELNYFQHSNNLTAIDLNSRFSPYPLFSFEINFSDLKEKLNSRFDHLKIYSVFLNYNRLKNEHIAFYWGLGIMGLLGDKANNGFAVNTGIDIFPASPISLSTNYNLGFINDTEVHDFSAKLKYHLERIYFSLGYQQYTAGQVSINGWTLGIGFYL
jgi:hypothetical protein